MANFREVDETWSDTIQILQFLLLILLTICKTASSIWVLRDGQTYEWLRTLPPSGKNCTAEAAPPAPGSYSAIAD